MKNSEIIKSIKAGEEAGVEAVIDRNTGENLIPGQCRPCDDKSDAIDVAFEMMA